MHALKTCLAIFSGITLASCATKNVAPTDPKLLAREEMNDYYACMAGSADEFSQSTTGTPSEILIAARAECRLALDAFKSKIQNNDRLATPNTSIGRREWCFI